MTPVATTTAIEHLRSVEAWLYRQKLLGLDANGARLIEQLLEDVF